MDKANIEGSPQKLRQEICNYMDKENIEGRIKL